MEKGTKEGGRMRERGEKNKGWKREKGRRKKGGRGRGMEKERELGRKERRDGEK